MTDRPRCIVAWCKRAQPKNSLICGRCWSYVPVETRLAINGHTDAYDHPEAWGVTTGGFTTWRTFVVHSWYALLATAAIQSREAQDERFLMRHGGRGGW